MDVTTLRTFLAAADTGSFSAAAQRVNASPSSVTERIKQLEHRLGTRLFDRDKRGCRLTQPGQRFLGPAQQMVRAWEAAGHDVRLPERYARSVALGGQYVLWERALIDWMGALREELPDLAMRVTAGASARLNRDLAEGHLDMVLLYDPVFRREIEAEEVAGDRLVLVTGGDPADWRRDFVPIQWGQTMGLRIASRLGVVPQAGLILDLGARSAGWLEAQRMAGYMPERAVRTALAEGRLRQVSGAPRFDYPIFACWRREFDPDLARAIVASLKSLFVSTGPSG